METCAIVLVTLAASMASAEPELRSSGLKVEYLQVPEACDRKASSGQILSMHYTETLDDGSEFDSNVKIARPKTKIAHFSKIKGLAQAWVDQFGHVRNFY